MLKKRLILAALLSLVVVMTAASSAMMQQNEMLREEFHQTYPFSAAGRVSLNNINGAVRVVTWERNEVKVDAVKSAYRRDRLDEVKIVVRADVNAIHVETNYPHRTQSFTDGEGRYNNPATVEYTLTVPRTARIDSIELINGDLDIAGITGDVKASSINGRVSVRELSGEVRLSTINGKLEAMFGSLNETKAISLGSVNGPVALTIPSDSNAEIKAGTVHGGISNDFGLPVRRGDYVGRDLAGQLGQGGARIKLGNVNGSITIRHAADGRPLSRATNLLAEKVKNKTDKDKDDDYDFDVDEERSEARRVTREAALEAARAREDARNAQREAARAQREAQRAQRQAQAEGHRSQEEARQAQAEAQRLQREAQRAQAEAQREAQRAVLAGQAEARRAQIEAQRVQSQARAEAQRERAEALRVAQEARRVAQVEAAKARVDAQRIAREAERAVRAEMSGSNTSLRLVERDTKTFNVSGSPQVTLHTFDGYITVHGWDKPQVQINISKRAATEQQMRGINLRTVNNDSVINFTATFDSNFQQRGNVSYTHAVVNLEVYVPRSSAVRLISGDGRLELNGVNGKLDLNTGDGWIDVRDARGRLNAKTGDGRIQIENFNGDVDAHTGDGRIILNGTFAQLAARTGSGSILLTVPANFNATLEAEAESVDNQGLNLTEESNTSSRLKRYKIGQGGRLLSLRTGEGRIFLRRAGQ
jgi:DUF4097 and DUF4098 domain-containing protein YvlB